MPCCRVKTRHPKAPTQSRFLHFLQNPASRALAKQLDEGGMVPQDLLNHYTVIQAGWGQGNYTQVGWAGCFAACWPPPPQPTANSTCHNAVHAAQHPPAG